MTFPRSNTSVKEASSERESFFCAALSMVAESRLHTKGEFIRAHECDHKIPVWYPEKCDAFVALFLNAFIGLAYKQQVK